MADVTLYDHPASICSQMARMVLEEKGVDYTRRTIDISGERNEQFEPWYVTLNPKAVVPTLQHGETVVCDTLVITDYVDANLDGPALRPDGEARDENHRWMKAIMAPHYGVLLYGPLVDDDGRCHTIEERGRGLTALLERQPESRALLEHRIARNARFVELLADADARQAKVDECHALVRSMEAPLSERAFLADDSFRIADAFAAAALARFESHGFAAWWADLPHVSAYYQRLQERPSWAAAGILNGDLAYHG